MNESLNDSPEETAKESASNSSRDSCLKSLTIGTAGDARSIAVRQRPAAGANAAPALLWLGGFKSDMQGTKAVALDAWAAGHGRACTRFDYSGHGESGGDFTAGTIGRWLEECTAVFTEVCRGPQVVVGSSMGGWLALLLTRTLQNMKAEGKAHASIAGMVLIAPAVDFTEELMWKKMTPEIRRTLDEHGRWERPSEYSTAPYIITRALIEEGRSHLLMGGLIETGCPVRVLQGVQDADVPWEHAVDLVARFARDDVVLTLVKDGDHRLSRPEDIERLLAAVAEF